jgi:hypothetical protein
VTGSIKARGDCPHIKPACLSCPIRLAPSLDVSASMLSSVMVYMGVMRAPRDPLLSVTRLTGWCLITRGISYIIQPRRAQKSQVRGTRLLLTLSLPSIYTINCTTPYTNQSSPPHISEKYQNQITLDRKWHPKVETR